MKISVNNFLFYAAFLSLVVFTIIPVNVVGIISIVMILCYIVNSCKVKKNFIFSIVFILMFQMVTKDYSNELVKFIVGYLDEFLVCVFLIFIIKETKNKVIKYKKFEKRIIVYFFVYTMIAVTSNIMYKIQGLFPIIIDILTCSKFLIMYFFAKGYYQKYLQNEEIIDKDVTYKCRFITIVLFCLTIANIVIPQLYKKFDYRYFMYSIQLFFPHPTYLAAVGILLIIILTMSKYKGNFKYIVMLSVIVAFTFRSKALVTVTAILILYIGFYKFQLRSKILWCALILVWGYEMSYSQVQLYYNNTSVDTIRSSMTTDGINLANKYFPLGTGFGTYGSTSAFQFKSKLYFQLGYFHGEETTAAMGDVFWPAVIAESGWIGTIFFSAIIIEFLLYSMKIAQKDAKAFVSIISVFIYELVTSTSETAFFSPIASSYFIILGFLIQSFENERDREMKS